MVPLGIRQLYTRCGLKRIEIAPPVRPHKRLAASWVDTERRHPYLLEPYLEDGGDPGGDVEVASSNGGSCDNLR